MWVLQQLPTPRLLRNIKCIGFSLSQTPPHRTCPPCLLFNNCEQHELPTWFPMKVCVVSCSELSVGSLICCCQKFGQDLDSLSFISCSSMRQYSILIGCRVLIHNHGTTYEAKSHIHCPFEYKR